MKNLFELVGEYANAVGKYGPDSDETRKVRAAHQDDTEFLALADSLDDIKRKFNTKLHEITHEEALRKVGVSIDEGSRKYAAEMLCDYLWKKCPGSVFHDVMSESLWRMSKQPDHIHKPNVRKVMAELAAEIKEC